MAGPRPANGRFSPKVGYPSDQTLPAHVANASPPAIDHIRNTQHTERHLGNEVARLQREVEYSREAQKENELLKTEVQVMYQTLKRLDANAPHVYGHFTNQLSQPNGGPSSGISLPPLNPPGSSAGRQHEYAPHPQHPSQPSQTGGAAMQGVEYAYGQAR